MRLAPIVALSCLGFVALVGCSSGDSTSDGLSTPSSGGGGQSGTGGSGTGGDAGAAGSSGTGGAAGAGAGGTAGAAGSGAGGADSFWPGDYSASGSPNPSNGEHNAGKNCMTCHSGGEERWLFGGTVYQADGTSPAAHVQVGVRDGAALYTAYSATNGNFWVPATGAGAVDWANAEVRLRNANGEKVMGGVAAAGCNSCHTGGMALVEP